MKITRRSLFGILAGAAAAPVIPAPSTPIGDVRSAMRAIGVLSDFRPNVMLIVPPREVVGRMIARAIIKAHERHMADPMRGRLRFPVGP